MDVVPAGVCSSNVAPRVPWSSMSLAKTLGSGGADRTWDSVAAEVPQIDRLVLVGMAASPTVLGVGGVLHLRRRHRRILHAEVGDRGVMAAEVGDQGVIGIGGQPGGGRQPRHHGRPPIGDRLQLAVPIQLVPEEVAQHQRAGMELRRHPVQPELVDLEQSQLAVDATAAPGGIQQRRRHSSGHVGPRTVVDET